jgi:hypothetical protein
MAIVAVGKRFAVLVSDYRSPFWFSPRAMSLLAPRAMIKLNIDRAAICKGTRGSSSPRQKLLSGLDTVTLPTFDPWQWQSPRRS